MRRVRLLWLAAGTALLVAPAAANADMVAVSPAVSGPIVTGLIGAVACGVLVVVVAAVLIIRRMVRGGRPGASDTTPGAYYGPDQSLVQSDAGSAGYVEDASGHDADPRDADRGDGGSDDAGSSEPTPSDSGGWSWDGGGDSGGGDSSGGGE